MKKSISQLKRNPDNSNHLLHHGKTWRGLPVNTNHGPLSEMILVHVDEILKSQLRIHQRLLVIRFDLRFPDGTENEIDSTMGRFSKALQQNIRNNIQIRLQAGKRVHPCEPSLTWVREQESSELPHYHCFLSVSLDCYRGRGRLRNGDDDDSNETLVKMIRKAWATALSLDVEKAGPLVHFPDNGQYRLNAKASDFASQYQNAFFAISYLTKITSKRYGDGKHSFRTVLMSSSR